jgi:hypothetical protein
MIKLGTYVSVNYNHIKVFLGKFVQEIGGDLERFGSILCNDLAYVQVFSRHRNISSLTPELTPEINATAIVSPNSTIVGDVSIKGYSTIGYNTVLRAEHSTIR